MNPAYLSTFWFVFVLGVISAIVYLVVKFAIPPKATVAAIVKGGTEGMPRMRLLLPLYIYPTPDATPGMNDYTRAGQAMKTLSGRMDIIVNPASGAGAVVTPNRDWVAALNQLKTNAGTSWHKLHGYISTNYTDGSIDVAKAQMDGYVKKRSIGDATIPLWSDWVGNFFFDEVRFTEDGDIPYYTELINYAQKIAPGSTVILNPGTIGNAVLPPAVVTLPGVASVVIFETGREKWFKMKKQPEPSSMNTAIVALSPTFDPANNSEDASFLADIKAKKFGSLFVNHLNCDYNSLPPYWDSLVEAIRKN